MKHWIITIIFLMGLVPLLTFSQTVALELEKMKVFYIGVDNPIKIAVENYPCEKIILRPTYGTVNLTTDSCHYTYRIDSCEVYNENLFVGVKAQDSVYWIDTLNYRLKKIPDPVVYVAGTICCHYLDRDQLLKANFLYAATYNIDIDINYSVLQYSILIKRNGKEIYKEENIKGGYFSTGLTKQIENSISGDKYDFYDVKIKTNYKCYEVLPGPLIWIN